MKDTETPDDIRGATPMDWIQAIWLKRYIDEVERRHLDAHDLLERWGLNLEAIANVRSSVGRADAVRLLNILATFAPPDFGVGLGLRHSVGKESLFGFTLRSCRTYGQYIDKWQGHAIYCGYLPNIRSIVDGEGWHVEMSPPETLSEDAFALCVAEICAGFYPCFTEVTGHDFHPLRIEMRSRNDAIMRSMHELLGAPVIRSDRTCILLPYAYRGLPISFPDEVLLAHGRRNLGAIVVDEPLVGRLYQLFLQSAGGIPTLETAARALDLSKRSLNRALSHAGWTYTDVVASYRRDLTMELLRTNEVSVKEIAASIGYADPNSLRRAFREWTGMSILRWSREYVGVPPPRNLSIIA